jgi:hypothetical protein
MPPLSFGSILFPRSSAMVSRLTLAALVLALLSACAPGNDVSPTGDAAITSFSTTPFYVDFRTRPYFTISHTFIEYGAQDPTGHPLERKTVGFFPHGGAFGPFIGVVAIAGEVGAEDYYADLPSSATFHRNLTAEQYERLTRYIDSERGNPQVFNLIFNNCNDFVAGAAHAIGLNAPFLRMLPPPYFIMLLAQMNS